MSTERRFVGNYRETATDEAGLVLTSAGEVAVVASGVRTPLLAAIAAAGAAQTSIGGRTPFKYEWTPDSFEGLTPDGGGSDWTWDFTIWPPTADIGVLDDQVFRLETAFSPGDWEFELVDQYANSFWLVSDSHLIPNQTVISAGTELILRFHSTTSAPPVAGRAILWSGFWE